VGPDTIDLPIEHRKTVAQELHNGYRVEEDDFLKNIAPGDEYWVHH